MARKENSKIHQYREYFFAMQKIIPCIIWGGRDTNSRPSDYQSLALPQQSYRDGDVEKSKIQRVKQQALV